MVKKVLIISYYFWPEENPRSQRAFELAREFKKRNFDVTIITKKLRIKRYFDEKYTLIEIPLRSENVDRFIPLSKNQLRKDKVNSVCNKKPLNLRFKLPAVLQLWKLIMWPSLQEYEFYNKGLKIIKSIIIPYKYDITISISYPYSSHILAKNLLKNGFTLGTLIADCGDPYTYNPDFDFSIINHYKEKKLLSVFDYISVPTAKAIPAFLKLGINKKKICVIPQGFAFNISKDFQFKLPQVKESPTFIYGGAFYKTIRNPENFFEALCTLKKRGKPFHFFVFTHLNDSYVQFLIKKYKKKLLNNLSFHEILTRSSFLDALRQADYAINFVNNSAYQEPSKLIDYALTQVKTYDIKMNMSPNKIIEKINLNQFYTPELKSDFNIVNVADKFLLLSNQLPKNY